MATLSDDFNRADGALGSSWGGYPAAMSVVSNTAGATGTGTRVSWLVTSNDSDDVDVQATLKDATTAGYTASLIARADGTGTSDSTAGARYMMRFAVTNNRLEFRKKAALTATITSLATVDSNGVVAGDVIRFRVQGSVLTVYVNGVQKLTFTDSTSPITGSGQRHSGMSCLGVIGSVWDDFSSADVSTGTTITVPGTTATATAPPPTLGLGTGVTVPASTVTATAPAPTITGSTVVTVTVPAVNVTATAPAPTLTAPGSPATIAPPAGIATGSPAAPTITGLGGGRVLTDDFNRADASTIGAVWHGSSPGLAIISNAAGNASTGTRLAWNVTANDTDDVLVEGVLVTNTIEAGLIARRDDVGTTDAASGSYYGLRWIPAVNRLLIRRKDPLSGAIVIKATLNAANIQAGDRLGLKVQGSVVTGYVNGAAVLTWTDPSPFQSTANRHSGLGTQGAIGAVWDSWSSSDLSVASIPTVLVAPAITATANAPAPTVTPASPAGVVVLTAPAANATAGVIEPETEADTVTTGGDAGAVAAMPSPVFTVSTGPLTVTAPAGAATAAAPVPGVGVPGQIIPVAPVATAVMAPPTITTTSPTHFVAVPLTTLAAMGTPFIGAYTYTLPHGRTAVVAFENRTLEVRP